MMETTMNECRIVYASKDRVCIEMDGVVIHAEREGNWIEARTSGTGGPMSGDLFAKSEKGLWVVAPSDADYHRIDEMFAQASRILREREDAPAAPGY
jgi:hypothetical protein